MSRALYCDKCGKLFKEGQSPKVTLKFEKYNDEMEAEMCSDCLDDLECYFYAEKEGKKK